MKHSRRRACANYVEFNIRKEDEEIIRKGLESDTTLTTRSNHSPAENSALAELMEMIKIDFSSRVDSKEEKKRGLKNLILESIIQEISASAAKAQKKCEPESPKKKLKKPKQKKLNAKSKSMKEPELPVPPTIRSRKGKGSIVA